MPNHFGFIARERNWLLDCNYDIITKRRSPFYTVSVLGKDRKFKVVGAVPVDVVEFDPTKKQAVNTDFLDHLTIED